MGRHAFLTGAAGDLGRAAAVALAADGWGLLLSDHPARATELEATAAACAGHDAEVVLASCDVTQPDELATVLDAFAGAHGAPAAVLANAGLQGEFAPIHACDPATAARVLEVNVLGVLHTIAAAARTMMAGGAGGAIVATASMAGVSGAPNMAAYSASKAAVVGLAKSAAKDLAPHGIRVNAISPAFIGPGAMWDTQVARQAAVGSQYFATDPEEVARQMLDSIPLRRYGTPQEVADVACYLLGDRSSYLTGINVEINGGSA